MLSNLTYMLEIVKGKLENIDFQLVYEFTSIFVNWQDDVRNAIN